MIDLITTKELSIQTGVHISTILRRLKAKGLIPFKVKIGPHGLFLWSEKDARQALGLEDQQN